MNIDTFVTQNTGQAVSYDGVADNIGQCEQLVCCYWRDVFGFLCPPIPAAKDLWTNGTVLGSFDQIPVGQEQKGDVAVFGASTSINSPEFGHTDIVLAPGFLGFDSNWGGVKAPNGYPAAHNVQHNYGDVLGFLRFKSNNGDSMTLPTPQQVIDAFNKHLGVPPRPEEITYYSTHDVSELYAVLLDNRTAYVAQLQALLATKATPLAPGKLWST